MTPAARIQTAIELLDEIIAAARDAGPAADTILQRGFKARRYAGSGDRRAIRELVYAAIRRAGERPPSGRAAMLGLAEDRPELLPLFDGSARGPTTPADGEPVAAAGLLPGWIVERLEGTLTADGQAALLGRAPLDLRVNRLKASRDEVLAALGGAEPTPLSPDGVRLTDAQPIERHPLFLSGAIEIQDEGSQLIAEAVPAAGIIVDLCAGAGGKTLALAAADATRIVACDTDKARLSRLHPRAERAGATGIETRLLNPGRELETLADLQGAADAVLVDAPCSGTGTWRRNPEARWRLTPDRLDRLVALQRRLLKVASGLVRPGGTLVYAVCSLLPEEGGEVIDAFLSDHPGWRATDPLGGRGEPAGAGRRLHPQAHGTDGFFVARLQSPC